MGYRLEEFPPDEAKKLTDEIQEVLKKYDAEMGTTTNITLFKRIEDGQPVASPIPMSDILKGNDDSNENKNETA